MKKLVSLPALAFTLLAGENVDLLAVNKIKTEAFQHSKVMDHAFYLTDVYGPRLTGSPAIKAAAEWVVRQFGAWGLANPHLEPWGPFGRGWQCTRFSAHLKEPQYSPLIGFARPWSPGTDGPVSGQPILAAIGSEADFPKFKGKLKGKIVLLEAPHELPMQTTAPAKIFSEADLAAEVFALRPSPNSDYSGSLTGPPRVNRREAQRRFRNKLNQFLTSEGVLVAVTPGERADGGTVRSTAAGSREEKDPLPAPSVALTPEHYNRIARLIEKKIPVTLEFDIQNRFLDDVRDSFNIVAELPGSDKKDELVMLGAHFDSWTGGTGATDNAAGSAVVMEVIRILQATGLKPRRTVRAGLWTGEEQGLLGSKAYVKQHFADPELMRLKPEHAKVAAYFNLDNGSGQIRGVYLQGNDMVRPIFDAWLAPFKDLRATTLTIRNTTGTDHLSFDAVGLPGFQFVQDPLEYNTRSHHTNMDVYDRLQKADLMQASAIMASFVYFAAMRDEMLPRKPLPKPRMGSGRHDDIEFARPGGVSLTLDSYLPDGDGPFPAAIVVHGGGFTKGDKQTFVRPLFDPLENANFAWFSINYRLAPQYKYPAAVEDVESAVAWVRQNAARFKIDPDKLALIGESAGGYLVSMAGARNKSEARVAAVVSFYGPHDVEALAIAQNQVSDSLKAFFGVSDLGPKSIAVLHEGSPITHVSSGMPPYLLIHGTKDEQVPFEQSPGMCERMRQAGASCDLFAVEGGGHGVINWEKVPEFQKYKTRMIEWLKEKLN